MTGAAQDFPHIDNADIDAALSRPRGVAWWNRLAEASLHALKDYYEVHPDTRPVLRVTTSDSHMNAKRVGELAIALQRATAKIGRHVVKPADELFRLTSGEIERAPLIQIGQSGSVAFFTVDETAGYGDPMLVGDPVKTTTELALRELCTVLPSGADDEDGLRGILGMRQPILSAMKDLSNAVGMAHLDISLDLETPVEGSRVVGHGVLTENQAKTLRKDLAMESSESHVRTIRGRLDGARSSRRIFYLIPDTEPEISGAFDAAQAELIRSHWNQEVVAQVRVDQRRSKAGGWSRPTYSLISMGVEPRLFDDK